KFLYAIALLESNFFSLGDRRSVAWVEVTEPNIIFYGIITCLSFIVLIYRSISSIFINESPPC
ncbi:MAG: hypothetical protein ACKO5Q_09075, partial [Microcystaceae cyanobacterium]